MTHFDMVTFEFGLLWTIGASAVLIIPFWKIPEKSGHRGWLSLLIFVPILNIIFLYYLAFSRWKRPRGYSDG